MKHAQFSLACTLLCVSAANFVLALVSLLRGIREEKKKK